MQSEQQLVVPTDAGAGPQGIIKRWTMELDNASEIEKRWRKVGRNIVQRYRGDNGTMFRPDGVTRNSDTFNILWSNTETVRTTLYNSTPEPVVESRLDQKDAMTKAACEVLRRSLKYIISAQDFDETISLTVQDLLLVGRGTARLRYVPTLVDGKVVAETIEFDTVNWDTFRHGAGRTWADVKWVAFGYRMTKDQIKARWPDCDIEAIPLDDVKYGESGSDDEPRKSVETDQNSEVGIWKTTGIYEIWDKEAGQCIYIAKGYTDKPLEVVEDAYGLTNFFPTPRPLYSMETSDSLTPVPEFTIYSTLADELETLTNRMAKISRAIRVRGIYPSDLPDIQKLLDSSETELVPIKNIDRYIDRGGLANAIMFMPLDQLVTSYQALNVERENVKQSIYEILGISDIMRGSTDAMETATAQKLKGQWGGVRLRRRQTEVQRYCRDLFAMAAELIAEKFNAQTLQQMTGLYFPSAQDKAQAQALMQQAQANPQMQQQLAPKMQQMQVLMELPTWDDVITFLRNAGLRSFRIDVQTDSTIALQDSDDQADMAHALGAITQMVSTVFPLVQEGIIPFDAAKHLLSSSVRKFRLGYELEDAISAMTQPPGKKPEDDPKFKIEQMKSQMQATTTQAAEKARADADIAIETHRAQTEAQLDAVRNANELRFEAMEAAFKGIIELVQTHLDNAAKLEVARITTLGDATTTMMDNDAAAAAAEEQFVQSTAMGASPLGVGGATQ